MCSSTEVNLTLSSIIPRGSWPPALDHLQIMQKSKRSKTGGGVGLRKGLSFWEREKLLGNLLTPV